jgi:hypothetical protein
LTDLPCCVLPQEGEDAFLAKSGPLPTDADDRRQFARFYYRRKAIVKTLPSLPKLAREETLVCVYVRDVSRLGVGFLYNQQLFPGERCLLYIPELGNRCVEVASCRRLEAGCYSIGSFFRSAPDDAKPTDK